MNPVITITGVFSPVYVSADNSLIDVMLTTAEHGQIPCTLHFNDIVLYNVMGTNMTNGQLYSLAAAGTYGPVAPYVAPPGPVPSCQLWQLQSVLTPAQWTAAQNAVAAMNNPAITAFFQHGTNVIPANSTTLASLATAIGVDPATLPTLVAQAAAVAIP